MDDRVITRDDLLAGGLCIDGVNRVIKRIGPIASAMPISVILPKLTESETTLFYLSLKLNGDGDSGDGDSGDGYGGDGDGYDDYGDGYGYGDGGYDNGDGYGGGDGYGDGDGYDDYGEDYGYGGDGDGGQD